MTKHGGNQTKKMVVDAFLTAVLFVLQVALMHLPNIELVSLMVILYTLVFGKRVIGILTAFTILEGLLYGFGVWWVSYLYIWPILAGVTWFLNRMKVPEWLYWMLSCLYGLSFGFLCAIPYLAGGLGTALSWWISGLPFDIIHGVSNLILAVVLFRPLRRVMIALRQQGPE